MNNINIKWTIASNIPFKIYIHHVNSLVMLVLSLRWWWRYSDFSLWL